MIDRLGEEPHPQLRLRALPSWTTTAIPASILRLRQRRGRPRDPEPPTGSFRDGDIVSLDAGVIYKGYHSDAARTYGIGDISEEAKDLIRVTRECFFEGIKYAKEGQPSI